MSSAVLPPVVGDLPDAGRDLLGYAPYAEALGRIIDQPELETPYTIGIYGPWGTGKTSFMGFINNASSTPQDHVIWFQPWLFDNKEEVWKALLYTAIQHLERVRAKNGITAEGQAERLQRLFMGLGRLTLSAALANVPGNTTNLDDVTKAIAKTERDVTHFINTFRWEFRRLKDEILGGGEGETARLLIFVDDLDRCTPESCIMALEAIKLFLDMPGCVFVLGIDRDLVQRGIELKYGEQAGISGEHYLEKLVQLPFHLPPVRTDAFAGFLETVTRELDFTPSTRALLALASDQNPRRAKRLASCLHLVRSVAHALPTEDSSTLEDDKVATVLILQVRFPLEYLWLTTSTYTLGAVNAEHTAELTTFLTQALGDRRAEAAARQFIWFLQRPELAVFTDRVELDRYMRLSNVVDVPTSPDKKSLLDLLDSRAIGVPESEDAESTTDTVAEVTDGREPVATVEDEAADSIRSSAKHARAQWDLLRTTSLPGVLLGRPSLSVIDQTAREVEVEVDIARASLASLGDTSAPAPDLVRDVRALEPLQPGEVYRSLSHAALWLILTVLLLGLVAGVTWSRLAGSISLDLVFLTITALCLPVLLRTTYVLFWGVSRARSVAVRALESQDGQRVAVKSTTSS